MDAEQANSPGNGKNDHKIRHEGKKNPVQEPLSGDTVQNNDTTARTESIPGNEQLLKQAELDAQEKHDAWLRAKAETENVRRRAQTEVANAHKYAVESFSTELLAVKDSLEAALAVENATIESLRSGVELTLKQLNSVFTKFNIAEINPNGEKFDPHKHQAMTTMESDKPANTVVNVMQKGYSLHDRILRPALVIVSKAKK